MTILRFTFIISLLVASACSAQSGAGHVQEESVVLNKEKHTLQMELDKTRQHNVSLERTIVELKQKLDVKTAELQAIHNKAKAGKADVDIYYRNVNKASRQQVNQVLKKFKPNYPVASDDKGMASKTTVFYYDYSYFSTAAMLGQQLATALNSKVGVKRGASQHEKNKLIVHIVEYAPNQ